MRVTLPSGRHLVASLWLAASCGGAGEAMGQTPRVEVRALGHSLHLLAVIDAQGPTNLLVSTGPDGIVLVDHPGDWRTLTVDSALVVAVRRRLTELGASRPRLIINTHWHGDHTGGNAVYGRSAVIVAHGHTARALRERQTPWWYPDGIGPAPPQAWPIVQFQDSMTLRVNDERIDLWNFGPAHTTGDAVVWFANAAVVHMGDLYHGADDPSVGGDMIGLQRTLAETLRRIPDDAQVVTGHGGVTSKRDLQRYHDMLAQTIAAVERDVTAGRSLDEVLQTGLPPRWRGTVTDSAMVTAWLTEIHRTLTSPGRR